MVKVDRVFKLAPVAGVETLDRAVDDLDIVRHDCEHQRQRAERSRKVRDDAVRQFFRRIQQLTNRLQNRAERLHDARVLDQLPEFSNSARYVLVKRCKIRRKFCGDLVFCRLLLRLQIIKRIFYLYERGKLILFHRISHIACRLHIAAQRLAACVDDGVQLLRGLGHQIHRQRVPLGLVFHVAQRIDEI